MKTRKLKYDSSVFETHLNKFPKTNSADFKLKNRFTVSEKAFTKSIESKACLQFSQVAPPSVFSPFQRRRRGRPSGWTRTCGCSRSSSTSTTSNTRTWAPSSVWRISPGGWRAIYTYFHIVSHSFAIFWLECFYDTPPRGLSFRRQMKGKNNPINVLEFAQK